jgi:hypothetical protein
VRQPTGHDSHWALSLISGGHTKLMLWTITGLHWLGPIPSTSTCHHPERCVIGAFARSRLSSLSQARMRGVLHSSNQESTCRTYEGWSKSYKKKCSQIGRSGTTGLCRLLFPVLVSCGVCGLITTFDKGGECEKLAQHKDRCSSRNSLNASPILLDQSRQLKRRAMRAADLEVSRLPLQWGRGLVSASI